MVENEKRIYEISGYKPVEIRLITADDSIKKLTKLLNKSYSLLLDMGLNYLASRQDEEITKSRVDKAYKCFVGLSDGEIISTISLYDYKPSDACHWYNQKYVAKVGQFAVLPELQKLGIGRIMMDIVEDEARKLVHISELALDTAETAYHLIDYYKKRDYRYIETIKWDIVNYKSVVLSKQLSI